MGANWEEKRLFVLNTNPKIYNASVRSILLLGLDFGKVISRVCMWCFYFSLALADLLRARTNPGREEINARGIGIIIRHVRRKKNVSEMKLHYHNDMNKMLLL